MMREEDLPCENCKEIKSRRGRRGSVVTARKRTRYRQRELRWEDDGGGRGDVIEPSGILKDGIVDGEGLAVEKPERNIDG